MMSPFPTQEEADDEERHKLLESAENEAMDDVEKLIQRRSGVAGFFMDTRVRLDTLLHRSKCGCNPNFDTPE